MSAHNMTVLTVRKRVREIEKMQYDDEGAHSAEDSLYADLLRAIAAGTCANPVGCATEALKTGAMNFSRWYA